MFRQNGEALQRAEKSRSRFGKRAGDFAKPRGRERSGGKDVDEGEQKERRTPESAEAKTSLEGAQQSRPRKAGRQPARAPWKEVGSEARLAHLGSFPSHLPGRRGRDALPAR